MQSDHRTPITHEHLLGIRKAMATDYMEYGGTVERWKDEDESYPDCSNGCRWAAWLQAYPGDWCVCTNTLSARCGLLTFEHQAGYGCFEEDCQA